MRSRVCRAPSSSYPWALRFTYFISSLVSVFEVDKLKPREGKQLLLVTQLVRGRVRTEPRYPELLAPASYPQHPCCPGPRARWCWWGTLASALAQFSIQDTLTLHLRSTLAGFQCFLPSGSSSFPRTPLHITFPAEAEAVGGLHIWAAVAWL